VRCVFAMATARQPARGPDSVVPLRRTVDYVAAALWRRVLHGGGLLGAGLSVSLVFLSVLDRAWWRLHVQEKVDCRTGLA